ncbi:MAG: histidine phosphatase family protein [Nostocoides sp.]
MSRRLIVEADGGSRGNPGVAGYGALVRDADTGAVLWERAEPLGRQSNNVAEYTGLIAGLTCAYAIEPGADIEARMDSKLVVEQMAGRWKIKHEDMRRLALSARDLVRDIEAAGGAVTFTWIPRERNGAADALSNVGMDGHSVDRRLDEPDSQVGQDEEPTRIVLVRHGVTAFTEQGRLDGRGGADPDLSETGRAQAEAAGANLRHLVGVRRARVITSSLARAQQTGTLIAAALDVTPETDAAFDEQGFGDWDGASMAELRQSHPAAYEMLRTDPAYARPGGESWDDVLARVVPAWRTVVEAGGTTVVVCHRKVILAVLADLLTLTYAATWHVATAPGSLTAIERLPGGELSIAFTNRT